MIAGNYREQNRLLPPGQGLWLAARCQAGTAQVTHTSAMNITTGDGGFNNHRTLLQNLPPCENFLQEIVESVKNPPERIDYNSWRYKDRVFKRIAGTQTVIEQLKEKPDILVTGKKES